MSYEPYASPGYYQGKYEGIRIEDDNLKKALVQASRHVDSLTYNRIVGRGFSNLTQFRMRSIQYSQATASTAFPPSLAAAGMYSQTKAWQ